MSTNKSALEYWTVWYPSAAATGLLLARGLADPMDSILLHAAPPNISVEVTHYDGRRIAAAENLPRTAETPICRLTIRDGEITRQDTWPTPADYGSVVLLPGGEMGVLKSWWNAPDLSEWRWQVEFYNSLH